MPAKISTDNVKPEVDPKTRVELELEELAEKIGKLSQFIYGKMHNSKLSIGMQFLLIRQLEVMEQYAKILACRLKIWNYEEKDITEDTRKIIRDLLKEF